MPPKPGSQPIAHLSSRRLPHGTNAPPPLAGEDGRGRRRDAASEARTAAGPRLEASPARHERPSPACGGGWEGATPGHSSHMPVNAVRSEEHTSELQSLMRISYAVFCLQKKKHT